VCIAGEIVGRLGFPFRMPWFTPLAGILGVALGVALVSIAATGDR